MSWISGVLGLITGIAIALAATFYAFYVQSHAPQRHKGFWLWLTTVARTPMYAIIVGVCIIIGAILANIIRALR